jgi:predicted DNA-binding transcriptional regulator AlpA
VAVLPWRRETAHHAAPERAACIPALIDGQTVHSLRLMSKREVIAATGLSRATIDRERRANRFPSPLRLSARRVAWKFEDIARWIESRRPAE